MHAINYHVTPVDNKHQIRERMVAGYSTLLASLQDLIVPCHGLKPLRNV